MRLARAYNFVKSVLASSPRRQLGSATGLAVSHRVNDDIGAAGLPPRLHPEQRQANARVEPERRPHGEFGAPGPAHEPEFTIEVSVEGFPPVRAKAGTKRRAEQDAARTLLAAIDGENADAEDRRAQDV